MSKLTEIRAVVVGIGSEQYGSARLGRCRAGSSPGRRAGVCPNPVLAAATREATNKELEAVGVSETPGVVVADSGYWHEQQMDNIIGGGTQVLIPPDAGKRGTPRRGWQGAT